MGVGVGVSVRVSVCEIESQEPISQVRLFVCTALERRVSKKSRIVDLDFLSVHSFIHSSRSVQVV